MFGGCFKRCVSSGVPQLLGRKHGSYALNGWLYRSKCLAGPVARPGYLLARQHQRLGVHTSRNALCGAVNTAVKNGVPPKAVAYWLFGSAGMVFGMVVVGGYTRLSRAGLSMTSWKLSGSRAPKTQEEWQAEFDRYKQFPEYAANPSMTIDDFKRIFHIEWGHRMLGRATGAVFGLPLIGFALARRIPGWMWPKLMLALGLGGTQGLVGWWMVKSGLSRETIVGEDPRVSPYRLAAHLTMAFATYSALVWTGMDVLQRHAVQDAPAALKAVARVRPVAMAAAAAIAVTAFSGAFVAGLDAGHAYNDWPWMAERFIPEQIWEASLGFRNFFENTATVQFDHRMLAYTTLATVGTLMFTARRGGQWKELPRRAQKAITATTHFVGVQALLGISTLMMYVPVHLGVTHQAGALVLWTCGLWTLHAVRRTGPRVATAAVRKVMPM